MILPDLLAADLRVVFCGTAASDVSARAGAYYANPTNCFWPTLYAIGLTPRQLAPGEFRTLLNYRIGLTDVAKHVHGVDQRLHPGDFDPDGLEAKMHAFQPGFIAFTSKKAASVYLRRGTAQLAYGLQADRIGRTRLWVLPSPSGAARGSWDVRWWHALAAALEASSGR